MAEMNEAEAWIDGDNLIIVVRDAKGGYYEKSIDVSELLEGNEASYLVMDGFHYTDPDYMEG
jgi:hypothetical protein